MQKVEGSNPFSRFSRKPRFGGVFSCSGDGRAAAVTFCLSASLPIRCDFLSGRFCSERHVRISLMTKAELHQMVDRLPDQAVDGAAILLREVTDGRIDPDQAWFWTRQWQEREREADKDLATGKVTRFESDEDFLATLDERTKPLDADA
jgi:hypothetical protein